MILKEYNLEGKLAIVTGAGRGIGKAIALTLAEAGADIVAVSRTPGDIERTAEEVQSLGRKCLAIPADVTRSDQVESMVEKALSRFGKIDVLVNNVGAFLVKPLVPRPEFKGRMSQILPDFDTPTSEEEWHRVVDTNLTSAFLCCRAVAPVMMERRRGRVINIASIDVARAFTYHAAYAASKAALSMFTRALALEWARFDINVNCIAPGFFYTALSASFGLDDEKIREQTLRLIPLRRLGELREIGLLAVYLASEASNYLTGQTIYLDGGAIL